MNKGKNYVIISLFAFMFSINCDTLQCFATVGVTMINTYFGLGADWLRFDLVIFAFGNS